MIKGITFDLQSVSSENDGHIHHFLVNHQIGVMSGCNITHDSNNLYIAPGYMMLYGRMIQIVGTETVPFETVSSGELYCKVVMQIDLSKTNTAETFLQGTIQTLKSASGYPTPTQNDLDNGGTVYEYPLAQYHVTTSGAESISVLSNTIACDWMSISRFTLDTTTRTLTIDLT